MDGAKGSERMRDNGWRTITFEERIHSVKEFEKIKEEICDRDRKILQYFLCDNLSASAISRKNDPDIICIGNRSKGKPLSPGSILKIVYNYFPDLKKPKKNRTDDKRVELIRNRQKKKSAHIKTCAFCGNDDRLEEHHMIPLMMGGTNDERNLIFLCHECHIQVTRYQMELKNQHKAG